MKNSLASTKIRNAVLRLNRWILPAILASSMATGCGPQAPQAGPAPQGPFGSPGPQGTPVPLGSQGPQGSPQGPQSSLVGQWRTTLQSGTLTISIAANGQYMQQGTTTTGVQTMQSGPYQLAAPNTIHFTVTNWSPKTKWMFVPNPRCGVPGVPNPTNPARDSCRTEQEWTEPQPPGSTYAYVFNGPNSMTLNNQNAQETITFTRVTGQ
jgi:hypothetical protein